MTKLSGTSGQLFAGLAESLARGVSRSAKGAATTSGKTADDSSFHDLLHTVSNMAKRALDDQGSDTTTKSAAPVRPRLAQLVERDTPKDEPVHESTEETKSSSKKDPVDRSAKAHAPTRLAVPTIVGQELAAAPAVTMQAPQPSSDKREASTRDERSATRRRDIPSATGAATAALPRSPRHSVDRRAFRG